MFWTSTALAGPSHWPHASSRPDVQHAALRSVMAPCSHAAGSEMVGSRFCARQVPMLRGRSKGRGAGGRGEVREEMRLGCSRASTPDVCPSCSRCQQDSQIQKAMYRAHSHGRRMLTCAFAPRELDTLQSLHGGRQLFLAILGKPQAGKLADTQPNDAACCITECPEHHCRAGRAPKIIVHVVSSPLFWCFEVCAACTAPACWMHVETALMMHTALLSLLCSLLLHILFCPILSPCSRALGMPAACGLAFCCTISNGPALAIQVTIT